MPRVEDLPKVEIDAELADRLRDAQHAYDEVKEYLDAIKDEIKARYGGAEGVQGVCGDEQIFTCVRRSSTRLNQARLKREWPDIYAQYAKTTETVYLTINRPRAES